MLLPSEGQKGGTDGTSGTLVQCRDKVGETKYGHNCRGGFKENKLQLVDVHKRGSQRKKHQTEKEEEGGERGWGAGGISSRMRSWLFFLPLPWFPSTLVQMGPKRDISWPWRSLCALLRQHVLSRRMQEHIRTLRY